MNMCFKSLSAFLFMLLVLIVGCSTESKQSHELTVTVEPLEAGTTTISEEKTLGPSIYQVVAAPNEHWNFLGWYGDVESEKPELVIFLNEDVSVTALFEKVEYPLTVTIEGEGSVDQEIISAKTTDYAHGTLVRLTPVAEYGWQFKEWTGDLSSETEVLDLEIDGSVSVTAVFERVDFQLKIVIEGEGTVEQNITQPKVITADFPYESIVELQAIAAEGWKFEEWVGDVSGNESQIEFPLTEDTEITARFERQMFTLTIEIEGEGSVEQSVQLPGLVTEFYPFETLVDLKAVPANGWKLDRWSGDIDSREEMVTVLIDKDKEVKATFEKSNFTLSLTSEGLGQILVADQVVGSNSTLVFEYPFESVIELEANPENGWSFEGWSGETTSTGRNVTVVMDSNKTLTASFRPLDFQVSVSVTGAGSYVIRGPSSGTNTFPFGSNIEIEALPAAGWSFSGWTGAATSFNNPLQLTVNGNMSLNADFLPVPANARILQLGDSITRGFPYTYRYHLQQLLQSKGLFLTYVGTQVNNPAGYPSNWSMNHEGHGGIQARITSELLPNWLQQYTADIALIHLGTNDILDYLRTNDPALNLNNAIGHMSKIINQLRSNNPQIRIYIAEIIPMNLGQFSPQQVSTLVTQWNSLLVSLAASSSTPQSPVVTVDMNSGFPVGLLYDGIHPDDEGASIMALRWYSAITRY